MPAITKRFVDGVQAGRHYDDRLSGFGLYVGVSGSRSYFVEYRPGYGRGVAKRRMALGKHGPLTPERARQLAQRHLAAVREGRDPLAEREGEKRRDVLTVATVVEQWLAKDQAHNRTADEVRAIMQLDVLPSWGTHLRTSASGTSSR